MFSLQEIGLDWTLFLDRDGVINHEKKEDYIRNASEFDFYEDAAQAVALLNQKFNRILITTNQKGIGKSLMTIEDLNNIHHYMLQQIEKAGGNISKIYFCPDLADDSPNRKPQPGMAFQAKADFPDIDFSKSIMVGNRMSDMKFGRNAGMHTVFLSTTHPETPFPDPMIDARFNSLFEFAQACRNAKI
ncbi:HAD-IIIA family hydrolase [Sediminibacterium sp. C3]|uniref:D-glycero-alpha-D-manno-heptose-1,7-bisphosphate 7-phosphatase n=1 Tax=Sediminibacterium sp. C3 TaxID=1267211 RepID=UPI0004052DD5|nr:HAD-IIIA family hydrolase [Sediminibacterium sp. C3]